MNYEEEIKKLKKKKFGLGYKVYTASLSQASTSAPVPNVLKNTIGVISYSRIGVGQYRISSGGINTSLTANLTGGVVTSITINNGGTGHLIPPILTIAPPGAGVQATATAIITNGVMTGYVITNGGSGYVSAPAIGASAAGLFTPGKTFILTNHDNSSGVAEVLTQVNSTILDLQSMVSGTPTDGVINNMFIEIRVYP